MPGPLLELKKLEVAYGGIHAVKGIDLEIGEGELVCLIGANGAGKTTTLKGICGLLPVKAGRIFYGGADITGKPAFQLVRRGLAMVPEGRGVFGALTIEENLAMGAYIRSDADGIKGTIRRRHENGREEVIEYRADFDREYPVMGTPAYDTIRLKRIDERTAEAVLSHAGRVFGTARRTISPDGKTLTITFRQESQGNLESNTAIYRKQ